MFNIARSMRFNEGDNLSTHKTHSKQRNKFPGFSDHHVCLNLLIVHSSLSFIFTSHLHSYSNFFYFYLFTFFTQKMHKFPAPEVQSCNTVQIFLLSKYLCVKHLKKYLRMLLVVGVSVRLLLLAEPLCCC